MTVYFTHNKKESNKKAASLFKKQLVGRWSWYTPSDIEEENRIGTVRSFP